MNWAWEGKVWKFGDQIPNDEGLMPLRLTRMQEYDPNVLAKHCFEQIMPEFAAQVQAGDFVVAGENFGHGNPHIQGFFGLKGLGVGLIVESISRGPLRACVNAGVPVLQVPGIHAFCDTGDRLRVDYVSGRLENITAGTELAAAPLPKVMRNIIAAGGGIGYMVQRLAAIGGKLTDQAQPGG